MSPITTRRMRSNGSMELSSRRPTARVTTRMTTKTTVGRRTRSTASGQGRQVAADAGDRRVAVVEAQAPAAPPGGGRIDLELQPERPRLAAADGVVGEDEA